MKEKGEEESVEDREDKERRGERNPCIVHNQVVVFATIKRLWYIIPLHKTQLVKLKLPTQAHYSYSHTYVQIHVQCVYNTRYGSYRTCMSASRL